MQRDHVPAVWSRAAVYGSLWAASEIVVGSLLHNLRIPFAGSLLAAFGVLVMTAGHRACPERGLIWRTALICALMKSIAPSAVILGPMIGIAMEGAVLEACVRLSGGRAAGYVVGGALAVSLRLAALPIAAALGGMLAPALIYLHFQWGAAGQAGWGIPMATDIAFVVGCLAVLGPRVPRSLRVLLLSLAIADDIGAILVIAIGYTGALHLGALAWGFAGIGLIVFLTRLGVRSYLVHGLLAVGVWLGFHESGVHATIAGVILGLLTPARPLVGRRLLAKFSEALGDFLQGECWQNTRQRHLMMMSVRRAARETVSPLERVETALHPWVSFVIMPLFAFANAGVPIQLSGFSDPVAVAIMAGLGMGKPIGIFLFSWLAVRFGLARLPEGITWRLLSAGGVLAGIGFTMSLFIDGLALCDGVIEAANIGILAGSIICALIGMTLRRWLLAKANVKDTDANRGVTP